MSRLEDRQALAPNINEACAAGTRLECACEVAGIDPRALEGWRWP